LQRRTVEDETAGLEDLAKLQTKNREKRTLPRNPRCLLHGTGGTNVSIDSLKEFCRSIVKVLYKTRAEVNGGNQHALSMKPCTSCSKCRTIMHYEEVILGMA